MKKPTVKELLVQEIEKNEKLQQEKDELQKRFIILYKANEEKKQDNYKLRGENRSLKRKNYELTILVDTFLKTKKKSRKKEIKNAL